MKVTRALYFWSGAVALPSKAMMRLTRITRTKKRAELVPHLVSQLISVGFVVTFVDRRHFYAVTCAMWPYVWTIV